MLFVILYFLIGAVFAAIGSQMAKTRNRDAAAWALICFLTGLIGVIVLAIAGDAPTARAYSYATPSDEQNSGLLQNTAKQEVPTKPYDESKWLTLKEFDQDISKAVEQIAHLGSQAEGRLATAYLAVTDKGLLSSIIEKILADAAQEALKEEERKAQRAALASERDRKIIAEREERAQRTIDIIKSSGMIYNGKKVISAKIYDGESLQEQGWAVILYEDGTKELRAGSSHMPY